MPSRRVAIAVIGAALAIGVCAGALGGFLEQSGVRGTTPIAKRSGPPPSTNPAAMKSPEMMTASPLKLEYKWVGWNYKDRVGATVQVPKKWTQENLKAHKLSADFVDPTRRFRVRIWGILSGETLDEAVALRMRYLNSLKEFVILAENPKLRVKTPKGMQSGYEIRYSYDDPNRGGTRFAVEWIVNDTSPSLFAAYSFDGELHQVEPVMRKAAETFTVGGG